MAELTVVWKDFLLKSVDLRDKKLDGRVAEWLRSGLQNRVLRFNSGRDLVLYFCRGGEIGIHRGLKIPRINTPCEFESRPRHPVEIFNEACPRLLIH